MSNTTEDQLRAVIWRQLVDYIDTEELFFPVKIRQNISEEAYEVLDYFIKLMISREMIVEFRRQSWSNRIAYWLLKRKFKKNADREKILEVYSKGPKWEELKNTDFEATAPAEKDDDDKGNEIVH